MAIKKLQRGINYSIQKMKEGIDEALEAVNTADSIEDILEEPGDLGEVLLLNMQEGDGIQNKVYKEGGIIKPKGDTLKVPKEFIGSCPIRSSEYLIVGQGGEEISWSVIESEVAGKQGLGYLDKYGKEDDHVMYNYWGDEMVQTKYLKYQDYYTPSEEEFIIPTSPAIPVLSTPTNPPGTLGEMLINVSTEEVFLAVGTEQTTNWRNI